MSNDEIMCPHVHVTCAGLWQERMVRVRPWGEIYLEKDWEGCQDITFPGSLQIFNMHGNSQLRINEYQRWCSIVKVKLLGVHQWWGKSTHDQRRWQHESFYIW